MQTPVSLKTVESKVFQSSFADGLWDVLIGMFPLQFAIAPLLSETMGDFWSTAIFLPVWAVVYLGIWLARKHIVRPRMGTFVFGKPRQERLRRIALVMLFVNILAFILGIVAFLTSDRISTSGISYLPGLLFGLIMLTGFSLAGRVLDFPRLYLYGLLLALAMPVGEWLYQNYGFSHHGYPIVFGFVAGFMILGGLVLFLTFVKNNPVLASESEDM